MQGNAVKWPRRKLAENMHIEKSNLSKQKPQFMPAQIIGNEERIWQTELF